MSVNNQESADKIAELRSELTKLDAQKKTLETEAEAIVQELTSSGENGEPPMGIDSPLVDREGFPRGDIDLYRARSLRKRFHEMQTDHKLLIKKIEEGLVRMNKLKVRSKS
jgi:26S proteasome non-ATPase regulatory subunit 9